MNSKPSLKRPLLRKTHQFENCLQPLINESVPARSAKAPVRKEVHAYVAHLQSNVVSVRPAMSYGEGESMKENNCSSDESSPVKRKQNKRWQTSSSAKKASKFVSPLPSSTQREVCLSYNKSNTPKYADKFVNVMVDNRLKRQCKFCSLQYMDLKGFNRHFESKHSIKNKRV
ncbi:uncharacterized protein LODBEIA_P37820 [Lodderomyces beijingensis]|uniref:C2H2-type domain-containing protein n=1 Tax=Lodderomyces beijingensis TaxID=1775926 RepID=A0ABP0ZPF7_9ASCO